MHSYRYAAVGQLQPIAVAAVVARKRWRRLAAAAAALSLSGSFGVTLLVALLAVSARVATPTRWLAATGGGGSDGGAAASTPTSQNQLPIHQGDALLAGSGSATSRAVSQCPASALYDSAVTAAAVAAASGDASGATAPVAPPPSMTGVGEGGGGQSSCNCSLGLFRLSYSPFQIRQSNPPIHFSISQYSTALS